MNKVDPKYKWYLVDLGPIILERAFEAKESKSEEGMGSPDYLFQAGRLMAFSEVVSIMQQQAGGFDIDLKEIGLHEINPDKDLT